MVNPDFMVDFPDYKLIKKCKEYFELHTKAGVKEAKKVILNSTVYDSAKLFDDTLRDIAITNNDIFSVKTDGGSKVTLFDRVSEFVTDTSKRDAFCRALINKLIKFSISFKTEGVFSKRSSYLTIKFD